MLNYQRVYNIMFYLPYLRYLNSSTTKPLITHVSTNPYDDIWGYSNGSWLMVRTYQDFIWLQYIRLYKSLIYPIYITKQQFNAHCRSVNWKYIPDKRPTQGLNFREYTSNSYGFAATVPPVYLKWPYNEVKCHPISPW